MKLTALQLQRAGLGIQREAAEVHVAGGRHRHPVEGEKQPHGEENHWTASTHDVCCPPPHRPGSTSTLLFVRSLLQALSPASVS